MFRFVFSGDFVKNYNSIFRFFSCFNMRIAFVLIFCFFILPLCVSAKLNRESGRKVLVLNSYHRGFSWSDHILESIEAEFEKYDSDVVLVVEYMDVKHNDPEDIYSILYELYKLKFADVEFEAIISSDNDALEFLLQYRDELFQDVPIVFCGVNTFEELMIAGQKQITGVTENLDISLNFDMIMRLYPDIKAPIANGNPEEYQPYERDEKLVRKWAFPGMKGFEHRIGGLEKMAVTGAVSYIPENHEEMVKVREQKVKNVIAQVPDMKVEGKDEGELLVVGWGGTLGHLISAVEDIQKEGKSISLAHFNYINPLPKNTKEVFKRFKKVVVCELNMGQFANYLRIKAEGINYLQYNKIQGLPFTVVELKNHFNKLLENK